MLEATEQTLNLPPLHHTVRPSSNMHSPLKQELLRCGQGSPSSIFATLVTLTYDPLIYDPQ